MHAMHCEYYTRRPGCFNCLQMYVCMIITQYGLDLLLILTLSTAGSLLLL